MIKLHGLNLSVVSFSLLLSAAVSPIAHAQPRAGGEDLRARASSEALEKSVSSETNEEVRGALARVLKLMVREGGIHDVVEWFTEEDQKRIGKTHDLKLDPLHAASEDFNEAWRNKYGKKFHFGPIFGYGDSRREAEVFNYRITEGTTPKEAIVHVAKAGDKPPFELRLRNEGRLMNHWRVEAPSKLTAEELNSAMTRELRALSGEKSSWPASEIEAYKLVAHRMLSVLGQPAA